MKAIKSLAKKIVSSVKKDVSKPGKIMGVKTSMGMTDVKSLNGKAKAPTVNAGKPAMSGMKTSMPMVNSGMSMKMVSTGKSGGSKKLASKASQPKASSPTLEVGVNVPAITAKGMKKTKGFRGPFNQ